MPVELVSVQPLSGETCELKAPRLGLWTPWADVTCARHLATIDHDHAVAYPLQGAPDSWHRGVFTPSRLYLEVTANYVPSCDGYAVTQCDECMRPIWVRSDVAHLWNFASALGQFAKVTSHMMQTGGMCAALCVKLGTPDPATLDYPADMRYLSVTSEDGLWMFVSPNHPDTWHDGSDYGLTIARGVSDDVAIKIAVSLWLEEQDREYARRTQQ